MDEAAVEAMAPSFHDLVRTCPVPASIVDEPWSDFGPSIMMYSPDGSGAGLWVDLSLPKPDRVTHVADQVQDWAVEELWAAGLPAVWPECPSHPHAHPMKTIVVEGQPVWICPVDWTKEAVIGELQPSA